jgi:predicted naringenin-chalcone synthase
MLEAIGESLQLTEHALAPSWVVWERRGNVVSSSIFLILRELQESAPPPEGALGVLIAFGAGVTCDMALLRAGGWLSNASDTVYESD